MLALPRLQIDRIESAVSDEPALVLVLAGRDDVECNGAAHRHAQRSHRIEHAVIRRSLGHQHSGCGIDVVERRRLGALPRIGVGAGHDFGRLAGIGVAVLVLVRAVDHRFPVIDIDAQAGAVRSHHAQPIGHRVEIDGGADAGLERLRHLALHRGLAGFGIDGDDRSIAGNAVEHPVGRPYVDADEGTGAFDIDLRHHLVGRRVDGHDGLAVDEANDPTCCLRITRNEARRDERACEREDSDLSEHDGRSLKMICVWRREP